jgi:hypothetical protein
MRRQQALVAYKDQAALPNREDQVVAYSAAADGVSLESLMVDLRQEYLEMTLEDDEFDVEKWFRKLLALVRQRKSLLKVSSVTPSIVFTY